MFVAPFQETRCAVLFVVVRSRRCLENVATTKVGYRLRAGSAAGWMFAKKIFSRRPNRYCITPPFRLTVRRRLANIPRSHALSSSPAENRIPTHSRATVFLPFFIIDRRDDLMNVSGTRLFLPSIKPSFRARWSVTCDCNLWRGRPPECIFTLRAQDTLCSIARYYARELNILECPRCFSSPRVIIARNSFFYQGRGEEEFLVRRRWQLPSCLTLAIEKFLLIKILDCNERSPTCLDSVRKIFCSGNLCSYASQIWVHHC